MRADFERTEVVHRDTPRANRRTSSRVVVPQMFLRTLSVSASRPERDAAVVVDKLDLLIDEARDVFKSQVLYASNSALSCAATVRKRSSGVLAGFVFGGASADANDAASASAAPPR